MPWAGATGLRGVGRAGEDWGEKGRRGRVVGWGGQSGEAVGRPWQKGYGAGCGFTVGRAR